MHNTPRPEERRFGLGGVRLTRRLMLNRQKMSSLEAMSRVLEQRAMALSGLRHFCVLVIASPCKWNSNPLLACFYYARGNCASDTLVAP